MSWRGAADALRRGAFNPEGGLAPLAGFAMIAGAMTAASLAVGQGALGWFGAGLGLLTLAIAVIDARSFIIPNEASFAVFGLGLCAAAVLAPLDPMQALAFAALRACALGFAFLAVRELYFRWRGREGIGFGDVKLAAAGGAWLDWPAMPIAVEIAALAALAVYALAGLVRGRRFDARARMPFGAFLAPAIWLAWLIQNANTGA